MRIIKRIASAVAAICVLCGSSSVAAGLGDLLQYYTDINGDVKLSAGVELKTLMPFDDEGVKLLNGVLKHMSLDADIITREDGGELAFGIGVDGDAAFTLTQRESAEGFTLETTLLPNRTLTGDSDIIEALFGTGADEPPFDAQTAVAEAQGIYKELTDGIISYAEEKRASYKIKSIGTAKWSRVARLTEEQGAELAPKITAVLSCGLSSEYREKLQGLTCQKGFVVALYRSAADGKDIAVYMKGNVTLSDGEARTLSYQWAFADSGTERRDTYKLELVKKKAPVDTLLVASDYTQKIMSDRFSLSGKSEVTQKAPKLVRLTTSKHDLDGKRSGESRTFEGTISKAVKLTVDGTAETLTTVLSPKLALTSVEGSGALSGTVGYEKTQGKKTLTQMTITFDGDAAGRLKSSAASGNLYAVDDEGVVVTVIDPLSGIAAPEADDSAAGADAAISADGANGTDGAGGENGADGANDVGDANGANASNGYAVGGAPIGLAEHEASIEPITIDISRSSSAQRDGIIDEMAQRLAGELLPRLARLPAEDAAILSDGMSDKDYQAFLDLLGGL